MLDTLLLGPSLHCNTSVHFSGTMAFTGPTGVPLEQERRIWSADGMEMNRLGARCGGGPWRCSCIFKSSGMLCCVDL